MDDQRAAEGIDHLQAAALEMIEAARAFLDVAERVVTDRERVTEAFNIVSDVARAATRGGGSKPSGGATDDADEGDAPPASNVQRITLSS